MQTQCSISYCERLAKARGWCNLHWLRWWRTGDPLLRRINRVSGTPKQRFWSKVDPCRTDGCALWLAGTTRHGYGRINIEGKDVLAHHFLVGKPPKGLELDHVKARGCTHKNCIWPEHLELVTHRTNLLRGDGIAAQHARATHCPQGHPYDETNTYIYHEKRACRICRSSAAKAWRKR